MSWSKTNSAHACLFFFEKWYHDRRDTLFTPSGEWSTDFLIKSAAGESAATRSSKANAHAEMLDSVFSNWFKAEYETGFDKNKAIENIINVLDDSTKKMKDLGDPIDSAYRFFREL